ncbi:MAG TPA: GNAT family N-acetyltransferase [Firmicutes bacterium]|nr:GNAT family N-acetyltransferase [Bacillota bacterium]
MSLIRGAKIALKATKPHRYRVHYDVLLEDKPIGEIELDHIAWRSGEAELKIEIPKAGLQNKGYGTDAVLTLLEHAFTKMNLNRVYLRVYATNFPALRCYKKAGFKKEWRLQRKVAGGGEKVIYLMGITKEEFLTRPGENKKVV